MLGASRTQQSDKFQKFLDSEKEKAEKISQDELNSQNDLQKALGKESDSIKNTEDREELQIRRAIWEKSKIFGKDTNSLKKYVEDISRFDKENQKDQVTTLKNALEFQNKNQNQQVEKQKEDLKKLRSEELNVIAEAFGIKSGRYKEKTDALLNLLEANTANQDKEFTEQLDEAMRAYKTLIREEAYGKIFAQQEKLKSILNSMLKAGLLFGFVAVVGMLVIMPIVHTTSEAREKIKKLDNLDFSVIGEEMLQKIMEGNRNVLGKQTENLHPFALTASQYEYFGRELKEKELTPLSALAFRRDILLTQKQEIAQLPAEEQEEKMKENEKAYSLINQQLFMIELNTRYESTQKAKLDPSLMLSQYKEVTTLLENKLPMMELHLAEQRRQLEAEKESSLIPNYMTLVGLYNNIAAEILYLRLRTEVVRTLAETEKSIAESPEQWQERIENKKQTLMSTMREKIVNDGKIKRNPDEPYESSRDRTIPVLLKLQSPYSERQTTKKTTPQKQEGFELPPGINMQQLIKVLPLLTKESQEGNFDVNQLLKLQSSTSGLKTEQTFAPTVTENPAETQEEETKKNVFEALAEAQKRKDISIEDIARAAIEDENQDEKKSELASEPMNSTPTSANTTMGF